MKEKNLYGLRRFFWIAAFAALWGLAPLQGAIAETDSTGDGSSWRILEHKAGADILESGRDGLAFVDAPFHFTWQQWALTAGLLGAAGASFAADARVRDYAQAHQSAEAGRLIGPWQYYGDERAVLGAGAVMYAGGLGLGSAWWRETGREALTSLVLAALSVEALKIAVGRSRPNTGDGPFTFSPPTLADASNSFPSAHAANAFALSTVLASRISNVWASAALYAAAGLTATQRVYSDNHWLSDALMGAILGTVEGELVVHKSKEDGRAGAFGGLKIMPVADGDRFGVDVSGKF